MLTSPIPRSYKNCFFLDEELSTSDRSKNSNQSNLAPSCRSQQRPSGTPWVAGYDSFSDDLIVSISLNSGSNSSSPQGVVPSSLTKETSNCSNFATQQPPPFSLLTQLLKNSNQPTSCSVQQSPRSCDTPWVAGSNSSNEDLIFPLSLEDDPASRSDLTSHLTPSQGVVSSGSDSLPSSPLSSASSSSSYNLKLPSSFSREYKSSPGIVPGPKLRPLHLRPLPQTSQPYQPTTSLLTLELLNYETLKLLNQQK
tara:strand:- start:1872 stop:2630 length:759 start_codon:yes stop_codon:yes gene_type:complete